MINLNVAHNFITLGQRDFEKFFSTKASMTKIAQYYHKKNQLIQD